MPERKVASTGDRTHNHQVKSPTRSPRATQAGHNETSNYETFNPLPDDKLLGLPKLKAFADDKLNVTQNVKVVFHRIENIVGKEENAGYQHFLLFPQCFQKAFPPVRQKSSG